MKKGPYYLLTIPFCVLLTVLRAVQLKIEIDERGLFQADYVFSVSLSLLTALFALGLFVLFLRTRKSPPLSVYKSDVWAKVGSAALAIAFFLKAVIRMYALASGDINFASMLKATLALLSLVSAGVFYLVASGEKLSKGMVIVALSPVYSYTAELILEFVPMTENAQIFGYIFKILAILSSICAFYLIAKRFYNRHSGRACALICAFTCAMMCVDFIAPYMSYKSFSTDIWHVISFAQNLFTLAFFVFGGPFFSCASPKVKEGFRGQEPESRFFEMEQMHEQYVKEYEKEHETADKTEDEVSDAGDMD